MPRRRLLALLALSTTLAACGPSLSEHYSRKIELRLEQAEREGMSPQQLRDLRRKLVAEKAKIEALALRRIPIR